MASSSSAAHVRDPYLDLETSLPAEVTILSEEECLRERKWWCFLLSSIFTFLMGVLSVVVVRAFVALCCKKDDDEYTQAEIRYVASRRGQTKSYDDADGARYTYIPGFCKQTTIAHLLQKNVSNGIRTYMLEERLKVLSAAGRRITKLIARLTSHCNAD